MRAGVNTAQNNKLFVLRDELVIVWCVATPFQTKNADCKHVCTTFPSINVLQISSQSIIYHPSTLVSGCEITFSCVCVCVSVLVLS